MENGYGRWLILAIEFGLVILVLKLRFRYTWAEIALTLVGAPNSG